jgi:UDP-N-acetylmuramoyl-L-alanyl-D-glutamate--2,6-diaminopimelate ligase
MERHLSEFFTGDIAQKAGFAEREGSSDPLVTGLEYDSRNIKPGNIYFALQGIHVDGHLYIGDAIEKGAAVIVYEKENFTLKKAPNITVKNIVFLRVNDSRFAMSPIAAAFYDFPSHKLSVIGVTGTEGKSTTVHLIWQLLALLGKKTGFISTVQHSIGGEAQYNIEHQTTPEATAVQRMLSEMADNGCEFAVLESSSHGLSPKTNRLGDVLYRVAVLTTLTHDHLEFHGTWEQYRDDKANLFRALDRYAQATAKDQPAAAKPFGVINGDDKNASFFARATEQKTYRFSTSGKDVTLALNTIESSAAIMIQLNPVKPNTMARTWPNKPQTIPKGSAKFGPTPD